MFKNKYILRNDKLMYIGIINQHDYSNKLYFHRIWYDFFFYSVFYLIFFLYVYKYIPPVNYMSIMVHVRKKLRQE